MPDDSPDATRDAPPTDPHAFLREDAYLGPIVATVGDLSLEPSAEPFERLIRSVLSQQVSVASAKATRERLEDAVDVTPEGILAADDEVLRDAGLSRQKTRYVNAISEAFLENDWDGETFEAMGDDEVRDALTDILGVGEWTADMFLIFALGREDVFPVGDLGIRRGLQTLLREREVADGGVGDPDELTRAEMTEFAERWRPYRSYASLYLWRVKDDVGVIEDVVEE